MTQSPRRLPSAAHLALLAATSLLLDPGCSSSPGAAADSASGEAVAPGRDARTEAGAPAEASSRDLHGEGIAQGSTVQTASGPVKGTLGAHTRAFLGIPYAAPPTGSNRFKAPAAATPWTAAKDATAFGPSCPQPTIAGFAVPGTQSEDCLTLNVWTPYPVPKTAAPVMVFLHGGGFVLGSSAQTVYAGENLVASSGVVLVTLNYRLGALGFLAHSALGSTSGNWGILDQQAALEWVKKDIAAFGGDPKRVTIFGESAGSISVCVHLVSKKSQGLFAGAIMESGACLERVSSSATAEAQGASLASKVGCSTASDVAACLRGKTASEITNALPLKAGFIIGTGADWSPIVDGVTLTASPMSLVKAGTFAKVPLLIGTNHDEGTLFTMLAGMTLLTTAQYIALVDSTFGATLGPLVLSEYPATSYGSPALAFADLLGDLAFVCPTRRTVRAVAAAGVKARRYEFVVDPSWNALAFLGSYHTAELPFVFENPPSGSSFSALEKTLSQKMAGCWTRFAQSGDPDASGEVAWPLYDKTKDQHLELDLSITTSSGLKNTKCDFWDAAGI
jgi:para-nitrobenzyl esterase